MMSVENIPTHRDYSSANRYGNKAVMIYPISTVVFSLEDYGDSRAMVYDHDIHSLFTKAERDEIRTVLDAAKDKISVILESALARIEEVAH